MVVEISFQNSLLIEFLFLMLLSSVGFVAGRIIFAMVGKFSVMNSFDAIFVFSAELFPTVVRWEKKNVWPFLTLSLSIYWQYPSVKGIGNLWKCLHKIISHFKREILTFRNGNHDMWKMQGQIHRDFDNFNAWKTNIKYLIYYVRSHWSIDVLSRMRLFLRNKFIKAIDTFSVFT